MPVNRQAYLQLLVLMLAVPTQYLISRMLSTPAAHRTPVLKNILSQALGLKNTYLSLGWWQRWCSDWLQKFSGSERPDYSNAEEENGESPAVEVFKYKDPGGYFAGSVEPRTHRPESVQLRVGQVVRHKRWGYRGIIVGWDPVARAPEKWFDLNHPSSKPHWRTQPNYSILVDTRDRMTPQLTYVPQENLEVIVHTQVIHPAIDKYFEAFDGAQYVARPWLRAIYPQD